MELINQANLPAAELAALRAQLPPHTSLMEFVKWGKQQIPPKLLNTTIALDEYTHEVLSEWDAGLWLLFSAT